MKKLLTIALLAVFLGFDSLELKAQNRSTEFLIDFFGDFISVPVDQSTVVRFDSLLSEEKISSFYTELDASHYQPVIDGLLSYRTNYKQDDWLYYQLIRRMAQQFSPKKDNYYRYTLYKWFLLIKSGFDATVKFSDQKLLLYVRSDENIYNIPYFTRDNKQYVCLNYHDYGFNIDFKNEQFQELVVPGRGDRKAFSYKIHSLPQFPISQYKEKDLHFVLNENEYDFKVKLNPQVGSIFANYPVVDYESYLNIPLSKETYNTLIPGLKKTIQGMGIKYGVDYLMRFTRDAFLFGKDSEIFGKEKRLSPEETLLFDKSDCEDRVALFFYLVKEIYNLPMIVLSYPEHVTIAVKFDKPVGTPIIYNGEIYSVCEPTPQKKELRLGQILPVLKHSSYEIAYAYFPSN